MGFFVFIAFLVFVFFLISRSNSSSSSECNSTFSVEDVLQSDRGVEYGRLRDLLKKGNWEEANRETSRVMKATIGKDQPLHWRPEDLLNFPGTDLKTINELWLTYSGGRFGFSVQKKIYLDVGANLQDAIPNELILRDFYTRLGWPIKIAGNNLIVASELTYSTTAPLGHLPGPFHAIWIKTEHGRHFWLNDSASDLPSYWQDDTGGLDTFFGLPLLLSHRDL